MRSDKEWSCKGMSISIIWWINAMGAMIKQVNVYKLDSKITKARDLPSESNKLYRSAGGYLLFLKCQS